MAISDPPLPPAEISDSDTPPPPPAQPTAPADRKPSLVAPTDPAGTNNIATTNHDAPSLIQRDSTIAMEDTTTGANANEMPSMTKVSLRDAVTKNSPSLNVMADRLKMKANKARSRVKENIRVEQEQRMMSPNNVEHDPAKISYPVAKIIAVVSVLPNPLLIFLYEVILVLLLNLHEPLIKNLPCQIIIPTLLLFTSFLSIFWKRKRNTEEEDKEKVLSPKDIALLRGKEAEIDDVQKNVAQLKVELDELKKTIAGDHKRRAAGDISLRSPPLSQSLQFNKKLATKNAADEQKTEEEKLISEIRSLRVHACTEYAVRTSNMKDVVLLGESLREQKREGSATANQGGVINLPGQITKIVATDKKKNERIINGAKEVQQKDMINFLTYVKPLVQIKRDPNNPKRRVRKNTIDGDGTVIISAPYLEPNES